MEARQVGIRELRQNLSKYLRRVQRGERLEVTEHGRPVAVLAPLGEAETPLARLVAAGRGVPPRADIRALPPPRGRAAPARIEGRRAVPGPPGQAPGAAMSKPATSDDRLAQAALAAGLEVIPPGIG